jgi:hypothetical protein
MTKPDAAHAKVVSVAHLPLGVLLELRQVTQTCFSSCVHNVHEEVDHATVPTTTSVRRTSRRSRRAVAPEVQGQLRQVLVQWMEALAKMIQEQNAHE